MLPVGLNVRASGSYNSALATAWEPSQPPAIKTLPLLSSVAVWRTRPVDIVPTAVNTPAAAAALGAGCTETVAAALAVGSATLVATTWSVPTAFVGAVNTPELVIVSP